MLPNDRITELLEHLCESVDSLTEAIRGASYGEDAPDNPFYREMLTEQEVVNLTGFKVRARQIKWLQDRGWTYALSAGGRPIVGREYLRYKLGGARPKTEPNPQWVPDFSNINPPSRQKKLLRSRNRLSG